MVVRGQRGVLAGALRMFRPLNGVPGIAEAAHLISVGEGVGPSSMQDFERGEFRRRRASPARSGVGCCLLC